MKKAAKTNKIKKIRKTSKIRTFDFDFDISKVAYEDLFTSRPSDDHADDETTLYFTAPLEWLNGEYPEAVAADISVSYPTIICSKCKSGGINGGKSCLEDPGACQMLPWAEVKMYPTKKEAADGEVCYIDYDWRPIYLSDTNVRALLMLARPYILQEKKEKS